MQTDEKKNIGNAQYVPQSSIEQENHRHITAHNLTIYCFFLCCECFTCFTVAILGDKHFISILCSDKVELNNNK